MRNDWHDQRARICDAKLTRLRDRNMLKEEHFCNMRCTHFCRDVCTWRGAVGPVVLLPY